MRCQPGNNFTEKMALERNGHTNRTAARVITDQLHPGGDFVDVGANCGFFTLFAARKVTPTGRVVAIEPEPDMIERLRFNLAANQIDNVTIVQTAVGDTVGELVLYVADEQYGHSSALPIEGHAPTKVPVQPLLAVCQTAGLSKIDVLKIDIEGYEDKALLPFFASATRSMWPRYVFIEIVKDGVWETDCIAALRCVGYETAWQSNSDLFLRLA